MAQVEQRELEAVDQLQMSKGGFNFSLCKRNEMLARAGMKAPKVKKTGTTIAGVVFKDGVVLGADTRATEGPIVCDKNCLKIHRIAQNIYCCGAGTSADTENVTALVESALELHRLETGQREPRVVTAMTRLKQRLFQYQGYISAALVLGGVDATGPHIYTVYPHGSTDKLPYATMGSGSLAAMAVFEQGYKDDMDEKEAVELESLSTPLTLRSVSRWRCLCTTIGRDPMRGSTGGRRGTLSPREPQRYFVRLRRCLEAELRSARRRLRDPLLQLWTPPLRLRLIVGGVNHV